jgi:hypothetical protein
VSSSSLFAAAFLSLLFLSLLSLLLLCAAGGASYAGRSLAGASGMADRVRHDGERRSVLLRRVVRVVSSLSLPLSLFFVGREVQRIGFLLIFVAKFKGGYRYEEIVLLDR